MYQRLLARRDARRNESGFTLIELLIVIVILGVLAAIVVFSVRGITDTGDKAACEANEKTAVTAIEAFYADSSPRLYPADLAAVVTEGFLQSDPSASTVDAKVRVSYTPAADKKSYTLTNGSAC